VDHVLTLYLHLLLLLHSLHLLSNHANLLLLKLLLLLSLLLSFLQLLGLSSGCVGFLSLLLFPVDGSLLINVSFEFSALLEWKVIQLEFEGLLI
jgi:hypothetical protein